LTVNLSRVAMEGSNREFLRSFNSQPCRNQRWVINLDGVVIEILEAVLAKIKVNPTRSIGFFNAKIQMTTEVSVKEMVLNLHVLVQELEMGVFQHNLTMLLGEG